MGKFWRTTITVEVLSEGESPPDYESYGLDALARDITVGDCSGMIGQEHEEVSTEEMYDLLITQHSDPAFLLSEEELEEIERS